MAGQDEKIADFVSGCRIFVVIFLIIVWIW